MVAGLVLEAHRDPAGGERPELLPQPVVELPLPSGRVSIEIVVFDRPHRVTFRAHSRIVDFDDAIELRQGGLGTRLTARMAAQPQGLMRLMTPLMATTMRKQFEANWTYLKRTLEASRDPSSGR